MTKRRIIGVFLVVIVFTIICSGIARSFFESGLEYRLYGMIIGGIMSIVVALGVYLMVWEKK